MWEAITHHSERPIFRQSGTDVMIATTETSLPLSKGGLEGI